MGASYMASSYLIEKCQQSGINVTLHLRKPTLSLV